MKTGDLSFSFVFLKCAKQGGFSSVYGCLRVGQKKKSNILQNPYAKEKQENNIILEQLF